MSSSGFAIKRLPEIKTELEAEVRSIVGADATLLPDSVEGQLISSFALIYSELWEALEQVYSAFNPNSVTGQALDNLVFLNGLTRLPSAPSNVVLTLLGLDTTVVPAGSIVSHSVSGAEFVTEVEVTIPVSGNITVSAVSKFDGAVEATVGTLSVVETPVNGWTGVYNLLDANLGRLAETDSELRVRRLRSLLLAGSSSLESILSKVASVDGVTSVTGVENFTDVTDPLGLPPHSFSIVALGGTDESVANAIWEKKPVGIQSNGTTLVSILDIYNNAHDIRFTRPTSVPIHVRATVTFIGEVPSDAADVLTQAVLDYVGGSLVADAGFFVGDDVITSRLYMPFNLTYSNHTVTTLEISDNGATWISTDYPIAVDEISSWDAANITITVG